MIKTILLDADGVLLKKSKYFSEVFSGQYSVPSDKIMPFFKNEFRECQKGRADIKEVLKSYLAQWDWRGTTDEFLEYWFTTGTVFDEEVLKTAQELQVANCRFYLVSDQEKYRSDYLAKLPSYEYLDGSFFSYALGHTKSEPEFFTSILQKLNLQPKEVAYWDDEETNVSVAGNLGIHAFLYVGLNEFKNTAHQLLTVQTAS